jgi:hypothetical protein
MALGKVRPVSGPNRVDQSVGRIGVNDGGFLEVR